MAHFAELDANNTVLRVTVVNNDDMLDKDGNENPAKGIALCHSLMGGTWIQCSYNGKMRGAYPGPGWTYDPVADVFNPPVQPAEAPVAPEPEPGASVPE